MASRSLRSEPSTPFYSPLQFSLNASSRNFQLDPGGSQVNPRQGTSILPWPPRSSFAVTAPQTTVDKPGALADSLSVMPGSPRSQETFGSPKFHTLPTQRIAGRRSKTNKTRKINNDELCKEHARGASEKNKKSQSKNHEAAALAEVDTEGFVLVHNDMVWGQDYYCLNEPHAVDHDAPGSDSPYPRRLHDADLCDGDNEENRSQQEVWDDADWFMCSDIEYSEHQ